jgi:hypothetical protein
MAKVETHDECIYLGNDAWDCGHLDNNPSDELCDCHVCKSGQMTGEEKQEYRLDQLDDQEKESGFEPPMIPGSGKSEKVLVGDPGAGKPYFLNALGAAMSVTQASLLGLPFGSGFHRDDAGRPMRTGAPVLTGKRLERMKKSCQHNHKTLTLTSSEPKD